MNNLIKRHLTKLWGSDKLFLSVRDASEKFKIPRQTIYSWIYTRMAKSARRIEGHWRIAEDEVERLRK